MAVDNNITVVGNLTADPQLRFTNTGAAVADLRMAVNRRWQKDGDWVEEASFFDVTAWSSMAENVAESLSSGNRVIVTGRLEEQRWEDKESGEPRRKVVIVADDIGASCRWVTLDLKKATKSDSGSSGSSNSGPEQPF
tara:strand:- start:165 stop:578 length:414 start_codon:yes stop_codon:yes gene_type:complete